MNEQSRTNQELIDENALLKQRIQVLEKTESERKQAEKAFQESERHLKLALEGTDQGLWEWDILSRKVVYDENWQRIMNIPSEGRCVDMDQWLSSMDAEGRAAFEIKMTDYLADRERYYEFEHRLQAKNKDWKWIWTRGIATERDSSGIPLRMIGTYRDITKQKQAEERLHASLLEKEILLGEVHHRVKNNMQVISGLLDLQARSSGSPELTGMLNESQRRIRSMALVHEKLYGSKDFARIDLAGYVRALSNELIEFHKISPDEIDMIIQTDSVIYVDINKAIPCGLILNELISNALKHAFPGNGPGELRIIINEMKNKEIGIIVRDNGLGLPDDVDIHQPRTVGLYLVNGLVSKQLDGQIEVRRDNGTEFRIKFPYELSEER